MGQCSMKLNNKHMCKFSVVNNIKNSCINGIFETDFLMGNSIINLISGQLTIGDFTEPTGRHFNTITDRPTKGEQLETLANKAYMKHNTSRL